MKTPLNFSLSEDPEERAWEERLLTHLLNEIELTLTSSNSRPEIAAADRWRTRLAMIEGVVELRRLRLECARRGIMTSIIGSWNDEAALRAALARDGEGCRPKVEWE